MSKSFYTHLCGNNRSVSTVSSNEQQSRGVHFCQFQVKPCSKQCVRPRSKSGSRSGSRSRSNNRNKSPTWSALMQSSTVVQQCPSIGDHKTCKQPAEPTITRTCACLRTATPQNTLRVCNSLAVPPQTAQSFTFSNEIVADLKNEINQVKSKLDQMTTLKEIPIDYPKQISQLKSENKHLKRQLEIKKKLNAASTKELEKAKDILSEYDQRFRVLHQEAIKSSKVMKHSKEKFCKCIQEKEAMIRNLKNEKDEMQRKMMEKESQYDEFFKEFQNLQSMLAQNSNEKYDYQENGNNICECIQMMEKQLSAVISDSQNYQSQVRRLKMEIENRCCENCEKLETKLKKQKLKYENTIKKFENSEKILKNQIQELSFKLQEDVTEVGKLQCQCKELEKELHKYENLAEKYKRVELDCQNYCKTITTNELKYEKDRQELRKLVYELTSVIHENKKTLLQLSKINKEQENLLLSQSAFLLQKEEQIKTAESEIVILETLSKEMEAELQGMRNMLMGPCNKTECQNLSREVKELQLALNFERDNKLIKEKIIQDQSQTICNLQTQVQEKLEEVKRYREESSMAEEEINKINDDLMKKHRELEKELDEKGRLVKKLKKLEYQKSILTNDMADLEVMLDQYLTSNTYSEEQQKAIADLKKQVDYQKKEWESQKQHLAEEKEKAVKAAKFATQKLWDTVADFQKQVTAQKKVQEMLTKLLHNKEEELIMVKEKISSINNIVCESSSSELPLSEIYNKRSFIPSTTPSTSMYSTCSNRSKDFQDKSELRKMFESITKSDEVPMRDLTR